MSSPRISFTYAVPAGGIDPWWIRLEQEGLPDDTATLTDAAELLNTLYNLDPCTEEEPEATEEVPDPPAEAVDETIEITVDQVACRFDADYNVDVVIRVIRSHQTEPYRLALQGGELVTTETVREVITVNVPVDNTSSVTLEYPVIDGFSASWRGAVYTETGSIPAPPLTRICNTLTFGIDVASGNLTATYLTEYDRCTVTILGTMTSNLNRPEGIEMGPGECRALAFFHGLVEELELETPKAADTIGSCTTRWTAAPIYYDIECYREVTISTRCECSDDEVSSRTYEESVTCPEHVTRCPGIATECRHLVGSITVPEYVQCEGDNETTGRPGMINSLSTPEYYEAVCCKKPTFTLPQCSEKKSTHKGGLPLKGGAGQYYSIYGPKLRIVPVSPPGGICGNWTIRQEILSSNCCDGVEPLAWDTSVSPEVMSPNSVVTIAVTGGRGPYTWTVIGEKFQFRNGSTLIETALPEVNFHALVGACGMADIAVTDGCSTVTGSVRSTAGSWVFLAEFNAVVLTGIGLDASSAWPVGSCSYFKLGMGAASSRRIGPFGTERKGAYLMQEIGTSPNEDVLFLSYTSNTYAIAQCGPEDWPGCRQIKVKDPVVGVFDIYGLDSGASIFRPGSSARCPSYTPHLYTGRIGIYEWRC
jgi:hypothetical protein